MSEFVSQPWRAAGGHRGVCAFCSAPSREHRLGDAVWERRGLRYRKVKSRTLEQSCHEQRTQIPVTKPAVVALYFVFCSLAAQQDTAPAPPAAARSGTHGTAWHRSPPGIAYRPASLTAACKCPADITRYLRPSPINFCLEQGFDEMTTSSNSSSGLPGEGGTASGTAEPCVTCQRGVRALPRISG